MITGFVEISQESTALATAETVCAAEALGGRGTPSEIPGLVGVELGAAERWGELAGRLALARRCLVRLSSSSEPISDATAAGRRGGSAAFRRIGAVSGSAADDSVHACGRAFKAAGGTIDLEAPAHRFWIATTAGGVETLLEEVASVDRSATALRKMPLLPFRRPVSLPPKLARAAVNLARTRLGDRVLDPFLGTGALLAEAGLLGGRLYGIDRDPAMVRGALQNLAYLGVGAEELLAGDARSVRFGEPAPRFSAIVTDPPYGRSSSTGGEDSGRLVAKVMDRWRESLIPGGTLVLIVPAGGAPLESLGPPRFRIPVRVHRSLTREFCVYEDAGISRSPA